VLWTSEEGKTKIRKIVMKYYDPVAKKIVFGWPLDNTITK
jgi:hypothetical protein